MIHAAPHNRAHTSSVAAAITLHGLLLPHLRPTQNPRPIVAQSYRPTPLCLQPLARTRTNVLLGSCIKRRKCAASKPQAAAAAAHAAHLQRMLRIRCPSDVLHQLPPADRHRVAQRSIFAHPRSCARRNKACDEFQRQRALYRI